MRERLAYGLLNGMAHVHICNRMYLIFLFACVLVWLVRLSYPQIYVPMRIVLCADAAAATQHGRVHAGFVHTGFALR